MIVALLNSLRAIIGSADTLNTLSLFAAYMITLVTTFFVVKDCRMVGFDLA